MKNFKVLYERERFYVIILCIVLGTSFCLINTNTAQPILAQACPHSVPGDEDGDDIPDSWEISGTDINGDGKKELDLVQRGADPGHKDLFMEIDYMIGHQPAKEVIPTLVNAFRTEAAGEVCNPDGTNGIRLHVQLDQEIPHKDSIQLTEKIAGENKRTWKEFIPLKTKYFGTTAERLDNNWNQIKLAKNDIYHYAIFAHKFDNKGNSGSSWGIPSMDFLVTLGYYNDARNDQTGTPSEQASTLMHEFGHNLNLRHGGGQDTNCKPNYLSIMSYTRQFETPIANRPLGFSKSVIETLNEANLDEFKGIGKSKPEGLLTAYGPGEAFLGRAGSIIDWNRDGNNDNNLDIGVIADVNYIPVQTCHASPNEMLNGYNDWQNLIYSINLVNRFNRFNSSSEGMETLHSDISATQPNSMFNTTNNSVNSSLSLIDMGIDNEPSLENEMTREDIRNLNTGLILSLNNNIQIEVSNSSNTMSSLSDDTEISDFYKNKLLGNGTESTESALSDESVAVNDTSILGYVKSDNLDQAISGLSSLKPAMDSSEGGALSDDAQTDIGLEIDNAIAALASQSCTFEDCTVEPKSANSTIEYG